MILIVVLYWLDSYYQNLLFGSVLRSIFLELFRLNRGLSLYVSGLYGKKPHLVNILRFLYIGFLIGVFVLGLFVVGIVGKEESVNQNATIILKPPASINPGNTKSPRINLQTNISSLTPNLPVRILPNVTSSQSVFFKNLIAKPVLFVPLTIGFVISFTFFILIFTLVDSSRQKRFSAAVKQFFGTWQDIRGLPLEDQTRRERVQSLEHHILSDYQQNI